jgi:hypothetical protein
MMRTRLFDRRQGGDEVAALETELAEALDQVEIENRNAATLIEPGKALSSVRLQMLEQIEGRVAELEARRDRLQNQIGDLRAKSSGGDVASVIDALMADFNNPDLKIRYEVRSRIATGLGSVIDKIECGDLIRVTVGGGSLVVTLREIHGRMHVAHIARGQIKGDLSVNEMVHDANRMAVWTSRGSQSTEVVLPAWEAQMWRWSMGIDGVLSVDQIVALNRGIIPESPEAEMRSRYDAGQAIKRDLADPERRAGALIRAQEWITQYGPEGLD